MIKNALYAPWPQQARATHPVAAIFLVVAGYFLSAVPALIVFAALVIAQMGASGLPADAAAEAAQQNTLGVLMPMVLVQFALWGVLAWLWARAFERRGPASFGYGGPHALRRYLQGLVIGVGLIAALVAGGFALSLLSGQPAPTTPEAIGDPDFSRLGERAALLGAGFVVLVFLVQGGAEELVFRGWLMSTLAARWSVAAATVVSSFLFALMHVHVFAAGLLFGSAALAGIGMTGLVFALLCLERGSAIEATAAHGSFNALAVLAPALALLAAEPELTFADAFAGAFARAAGLSSEAQAGLPLLAQSLVGLLLVLYLLARLRARRRRA